MPIENMRQQPFAALLLALLAAIGRNIGCERGYELLDFEQPISDFLVRCTVPWRGTRNVGACGQLLGP